MNNIKPNKPKDIKTDRETDRDRETKAERWAR